MKRSLLFLLALSLGINAWLLVRRAGRAPARAVPVAAAAVRTVGPALPVAAMETAEPAALLDLLRATGADDFSVRAMYEGLLRRRANAQLAEVQIERFRDQWWRAGSTARRGDPEIERTILTAPLAQQLGRDPLVFAWVASRYAFLPADKQRQLAEVELDYADLLKTDGISAATAITRAESAARKLVAEERLKDVYASLTPEEKAEYDLRYSDPNGVDGRAATIGATEAEVRKLKPLMAEYAAERKLQPRTPGLDGPAAEFQQATAQKLVDALGYERAVDFLWAGHMGMARPLYVAARTGQIAPEAPRQAMALMLDTARQGRELHQQTALTVEQKRAALVDLQQSVRKQIDALVPAEVQAIADFDWLVALGRGSYFVPSSATEGSNGYQSVNISAPAAAMPTPLPPMPVRPAGK